MRSAHLCHLNIPDQKAADIYFSLFFSQVIAPGTWCTRLLYNPMCIYIYTYISRITCNLENEMISTIDPRAGGLGRKSCNVIVAAVRFF